MGAALDNPDVVDKESALFAMNSFYALHHAGGAPPADGSTWLSRAVSAGIVASSWHRVTDVPNPVSGATAVVQFCSSRCDVRWSIPHEHWSQTTPSFVNV